MFRCVHRNAQLVGVVPPKRVDKNKGKPSVHQNICAGMVGHAAARSLDIAGNSNCCYRAERSRCVLVRVTCRRALVQVELIHYSTGMHALRSSRKAESLPLIWLLWQICCQCSHYKSLLMQSKSCTPPCMWSLPGNEHDCLLSYRFAKASSMSNRCLPTTFGLC